MKKSILIFTVLLLIGKVMSAQDTAIYVKDKEFYRHSIEVSPLSPVMNIYGVFYSYGINEKDFITAGPAYLRIKYEFGHTDAWSFIIGYKRYLWKNLHVEYQLYPIYDNFYESNENRIYKSFDVWNEFRLGYRFDFKIKKAPLYFNLQWPLGFGLYASNKPESFNREREKNPLFYFPPIFFVGYRFK